LTDSKNIAVLIGPDGSEEAVFAPLGAMPTKTERRRRMSRGYFTSKRVLSKQFKNAYENYLVEDLMLQATAFQR
jgi:hypothetical protein